MAALSSQGRHRLVPYSVRLRMARLRAWLAHRRALRRVSMASLALVLIVVVGGARQSVDRLEADWGASTAVLVAVEAVALGAPLDGAVEADSWPASVVPADAVDPSDLVGLEVAAVRRLEPGDVLTHRDIAGVDGRELADGDRALNVPTSAATPELVAGDRVELLVLADPLDPSGSDTAAPVDGLIIEVGEDAVTVSVAQREVVELAEAQRDQRLVVVRR